MSENIINSDSEEPIPDDTPGDNQKKANIPDNSSDSGTPLDSNDSNENPDTNKPDDGTGKIVSNKEAGGNVKKPLKEIEDGESVNDNAEFESQEKNDELNKALEKGPEPGSPKPAKSVSKESNYQISLIDENLLKILVTPRKSGVKIESFVKDSKSSLETQSNEICFHPKLDLGLQEVEVLISIEERVPEKDADEIESNESVEAEEQTENEDTKSHFLINLINENLLKIKISTSNGVRIDSVGRDKKFSTQTQSNKIYLKQITENDVQEIEIKISIESDPGLAGDLLKIPADGEKVVLIPNPDVVDLIKPPDYSALMPGQETEFDDGGIYKNPFDSLRSLIRKNVTIGLTAAVILHVAVAGFAFYKFGQKSGDASLEEPQRLIVLQDLPDPRIKLEDVEDPNKPKVEDIIIPEEEKEETREITPRRVVKPPTVKRPMEEETEEEEETKLDSITEANLERALDSLRQLREEAGFLDSNIVSNDSLESDTALSIYQIPDSLRNNFNENDIGLAMYFPKNWKLTDQREINKSEKEFKGVVITDTTAEQPGTMTLFIFLDNEGKDYNAEDFKTEFEMVDSNLNAFSKEPKTLAGFTEYRFYIFNNLGTEKLSIGASVRKQFFDQYKDEIEAVVRSINIRRKEDLQKEDL